MSKPNVIRMVQASTFQFTPGTQTEDIIFLQDGCSGMDFRLPSHRMPIDSLRDVYNMELSRNKALSVSRGSLIYTSTVGSLPIIAVYPYRTPEYTKVFLVTSDDIQVATLSGTDISNCTVLTGPDFPSPLEKGDRVTYLPWDKDTLLVTSHLTPMYAIDIPSNTYTEVVGAPQGAGHITLMDGRVVASGFLIQPNLIQWSSKFNYEGWDPANENHLGTGFEELLPSEVGSQNSVYSIWPFTDTQGLVVRQSSLDTITTTDNFDAPFRFQQRHKLIQTYHPSSVVRTPNSVIIAGYESFFEVTPSEILSIGDPITTNIYSSNISAYALRAAYNPLSDTYYVCGLDGFTNHVYTYNRKYRAWMREAVPVVGTELTCMAYVGGMGSLTYAELTGTYATQTGTLSTWGASQLSFEWMVYAVDHNLHGSLNSSLGPKGWRFQLNVIEPSWPSDEVTITHVEVAYSSFASNSDPAIVQYSIDGGSTWLTYGEFTIVPPATNPFALHKAMLEKTVTGDSIFLRVRSNRTTGVDRTDLLTIDYVRVTKVVGARETTGP